MSTFWSQLGAKRTRNEAMFDNLNLQVRAMLEPASVCIVISKTSIFKNLGQNFYATIERTHPMKLDFPHAPC